jgi:hypothetical protein
MLIQDPTALRQGFVSYLATLKQVSPSYGFQYGMQGHFEEVEKLTMRFGEARCMTCIAKPHEQQA